nr:hypothetical protein [Tanacetum cinerariifolium]
MSHRLLPDPLKERIRIPFSFIFNERIMRRIYNDEGGPRIIKTDGRHGLPWPGNANMVFDLRKTEDGLPWPGNANMVFDLRQTEDGLSWPGNANMVFDLRQTDDGLPWPGSANIAFDLVLGLQRLLHMFYIRRYLRGMHEDNYN